MVVFCNLNLLPDECYKVKNIFMSFILLGPNVAKDLDSFLRPLVDEFLELENGVQAFDGYINMTF